ncbi:MAG: hypothetical protein J5865_01965 [Lachnospiraceae bacterium]|nr:hypothetical protein [Lachnospiraceae bacterium]
MDYVRLPFEQYFINTSENYNNRGEVSYPIVYNAVSYSHSALERLLRIHHDVNYEIHYEEERNAIQVNFQYTDGFMDWIANVVEIATKYYDSIEYEGEPLQLRVHHGWGEMYRAIKNELRRQWQLMHEEHPEAETEILGWSLGSAQAILCAQDLNYNFGVKPYLYTFGTVKPFKSVRSNAVRMKEYLGSICKECWNFTDVNDIITYLPPFRGYLMINRVDVKSGLSKSFFRLLKPLRFHTLYDQPEIYAGLTSRSD